MMGKINQTFYLLLHHLPLAFRFAIQGPIAASRVGYRDGKYLLNPSIELKESELDLVVAGTKETVLMVDQKFSLSEKVMLDAVKFGHEKFVPIIEAIEN